MAKLTVDQSFIDEMRQSLLVESNAVTAVEFPRLDNLSAGLIFDFLPRPKQRDLAECVYVPLLSERRFASRDDYYRYHLLLTNWNALWEAGHVRHDFFANEVPAQLAWLSRHHGKNVTLIPLDPSRRNYDAYTPLYHIIPAKTLLRFGLPLVRKGVWPFWTDPLVEPLSSARF